MKDQESFLGAVSSKEMEEYSIELSKSIRFFLEEWFLFNQLENKSYQVPKLTFINFMKNYDNIFPDEDPTNFHSKFYIKII